MDRQEHLNRIKAKCLHLVHIYEVAEPHPPLPAVSGWKTTIAAVDAVLMLNSVDLSPCDGGSCMVATGVEESLDTIRGCAAAAILAAWPEELL